MAKMTFSLVVGANSFSVETPAFPDADALRIRDAYAAYYADVLPASPTNQQIANAIGRGIFQGIKANTLSHESAVQQPAIADIVVE